MAARALLLRALAQERARSGAFVALVLFIAVANAVGYERAYPTLAGRIAFARTFGANKAVELFYGSPHDLLTVGGYTAWRVGGSASIVAGVWALLVAVRALRGEEEAGRTELVLAEPVSRRTVLLAPALALSGLAGCMWVALWAGLVAGGVGAGDAAEVAVATIAPVPVFAGVGALASQLASTRRLALVLSAGTLGAAFLLRVVADTASGLTWLRWATPLGWSEELRAAAGFDARVLALPLVSGAILVALAGRLALGRDIGAGLLRSRDSARPRTRFVSSPAGLALRDARTPLVGWTVSIAFYAVVVGVLSTSFTDANIPARAREALARLGISITHPAGALGLYFSVFVLAISVFACGEVGAIRREEAEGRLETLFAEPVGRVRWLSVRLLLASGAAVLLALVAGTFAWLGAASKHAGVSFPRLLEAGLNCLPAALLFLALAALCFAALPRAGTAVAYGIVALAYTWQLFGGLLGAPRWLRDATPFAHVALVPAQPFRLGAAASMLAAALVAGGAALVAFRRRDLAAA
jgi:ABC-2 type transport system permease protein